MYKTNFCAFLAEQLSEFDYPKPKNQIDYSDSDLFG